MDLDELVEIVSKIMNVDITEKSRSVKHSNARAVFFKLAHEDFSMASLSEIGKAVGKSHTSVLHSIRNTFPVFERYYPYDYSRYEKIKAMIASCDDVNNFSLMLDKYEDLLLKNIKLSLALEEQNKEQNIMDEIMGMLDSLPNDKLEKVRDRLEPIIKMV